MMRPQLLLLLLLLPCAACDDGFTPSLSNFAFDGVARDSPTVLLLSTDFHDGDGDLGDGTLESFIDSRPTDAGTLALPALFAQSGLGPSATDGDLQFVLELNLSESVPASGSTFKLGVRVTDAAGNSSPTSEITLELTY